jgi:hypothetical protein
MASTHSSTRKRLTIALVGATALGAVVASAASLGGLTSSSLGANDTIVASCDTDGMTIGYTNAYDSSTGKYRTSAATITGIAPACVGQSLSIVLRDAGGLSIGAGGGAVVAGPSQTFAMSPSAAAEAVTGAAVVITG